MRVLIFTSSGGTAHDVAAYALQSWLRRWDPDGEVWVEHILERSSWFFRVCVFVYNAIQKYFPLLQWYYWPQNELEDLLKPGTVGFGRTYVIRLLRSLRPDLLISTHPHTNRGHFDLAQRILPGLRCITCCTELDGGFGFSRNWITRRCEAFWSLTPEVVAEVRARRFRYMPAPILGPLFDPLFDAELSRKLPVSDSKQLPLLVLGAGANGANNHILLLESLLPLAGQLRVVALCGRREAAKESLTLWAKDHPQLQIEPLSFQGPAQMAALYKTAWAMVARPGARTATEALAAGCVLIFNTFGTTMPQELLARRYFRARGIELHIRKPQDLVKICSHWLDRPELYQKLKAQVLSHRLLTDKEAIRELLLDGFLPGV